MTDHHFHIGLRAFAIAILLIAAGAFAFRAPRLDQRPMHTDEAVHAVKAGVLLDTGSYVYNPHEYHGPTHYYFALPLIRLTGARSFDALANETPLRLVPVLFGTGLVLLLLLFGDAIGRRSAVAAALLTALSPAMVFYSRYFIQEMLLVFFTFLALAAAWRYTRTKRVGWALLSGAGVGMMHASKETCVIAYGCLIGATVLALVWTRWIDKRSLRLGDYLHHWHLIGAAKVAGVVAILFLTAFLSHPSATLDTVRAYGIYLDRGTTGDSSTSGFALHEHPWHTYLQMLTFFRSAPGPWWSEALILILALLGIVKALRPHTDSDANTHLLRILAFYTLLLTAAYSAIPYKTPWCLLGFLHGMILLAGVGAVAILDAVRRWKWASVLVVVLFGIGCLHLGLQAHRTAFTFHSDTRNPYVYAHTSADLLKMVDKIEAVAEAAGTGQQTLIKVIVPGSDYWPLPWYLRRFEQVGFWNEVPEEPDADIVITMPAFEEQIISRFQEAYQTEVYGLRPEVLMLVYIRQPLWDDFIHTRTNLPTEGAPE